jgi:hypothetical protein
MSRTLTFRYSVPVLVTVNLDEKTVSDVRVDDETPIPGDVNFVDGDEGQLEAARLIADEADWPAWEFGL